MRTIPITFRFTEEEWKQFAKYYQKTDEFDAKSPHEAARFVIAKKLGFWYRKPVKEATKR